MDNEYLQLLIRLSIWVGSILTGGIVALALYIRAEHKANKREQKENLVTMMTTMSEGTKAIERNSDVIEKLLIKRR